MKKMEKSNKKLITISKINNHYLIPFLLPMFCILFHIFQKKQFKNSDLDYGKYQLLTLINNFTPKLFSFIFWKISLCLNKSEREERSSILIKVYHEKVESTGKEIKVYLLIIFISFLEVLFKVEDFCMQYIKYKKKEIQKELIEKRMGFIIFVPILSRVILKKKLYRHHIVSLIIAIIGCIMISIASDYYLEDFIYHIIHISFSSTFALSLVLLKYLMIKYFIFPFHLLFLDGIFSFIISIIIIFPLGIFYKIYENEGYFYFISQNFKYLFSGRSLKFYIFCFLSYLTSLIYYILNILALFYFSPYINVLTDLTSPFFFWIFGLFINDDDVDDKGNALVILKLIGFITIFLGAIILNELIIVNKFELNEDTFDDISKRGTIDVLDSSKIILSDVDDVSSNDDEL